MNTYVHYDFKDVRKQKFYIRNEKYGRFYKQEEQNLICFDIETSNGFRDETGNVYGYNWDIALKNPDFYSEKEPVSLMWMWQCAIEDLSKEDIDVYIGRTWEDFKELLKELKETMQLSAAGLDPNTPEPIRTHLLNTCKKQTITTRIYIHNLGFEFQHLRNGFECEMADGNANVFARQMRKPMRAKIHYDEMEIIFNDTLCLTQKSLKNWGKDADLPIKKIEEEKDFYMEIRTPLTILNQKEVDYGVDDVATMICGMREYRKKYTTLRNIPMTQTGEVRRKCEFTIATANAKWAEKCARITNNMTFEHYKELNACFVGGWTHANAIYSGKKLENLQMYDFRSSYPAVMVSRTYPVEEFTQTTESDIELISKQDINNRKEHYYVYAEFDGVRSRTTNTFWSSSKAEDLRGQILDNGKIYACDHMKAYMTDLDYELFCEVYEIESKKILKAMKAKADYLPKEFIETILQYYSYKTSLKDVDGEESKYGESKQFINSIYGVCVTKVITDIIDYITDWAKRAANVEDYTAAIEQQTHKNMFTCYQIGVWVTAWARHNLWDAIKNFDLKTVYCDTDSIKGRFTKDDIVWFEEYNKGIWSLCEKVANIRGINLDLYKPQTVKGKLKEIGFFDDEGVALEFKTLGAKRYVYTHWTKDKETGEDKIEFVCTIAGIAKDKAAEQIKTVDNFKPDFKWNVKESGKLVCHYNDEQPRTVWTDRDGNVWESWDRYGINLEPTGFSMGLAEEYENFLEMLDGSELSEYYDIPEIMR